MKVLVTWEERIVKSAVIEVDVIEEITDHDNWDALDSTLADVSDEDCKRYEVEDRSVIGHEVLDARSVVLPDVVARLHTAEWED